MNATSRFSRNGSQQQPESRRVYDPQAIGLPANTLAGSDGYFTYVPCHHPEDVCEDCNNPRSERDAIIIAVDGGCRNNGFSGAVSSYGVFFGEDSPKNFASILPSRMAALHGHTNQVAELAACIYAVKRAIEIHQQESFPQEEAHSTLNQIVIKTDSEHLYKGMTERVFKWEKNGWKTANGRKVVHRDLFEGIQAGLNVLEEAGVEVLFWWVPRHSNRGADALATAALNQGIQLHN